MSLTEHSFGNDRLEPGLLELADDRMMLQEIHRPKSAALMHLLRKRVNMRVDDRTRV